MLVLLFAAALAAQTPGDDAPLNCEAPANTMEIDGCMAEELDREVRRMNQYLEVALTRVRADATEVGSDPDVVAAEVRQGQAAWDAYAEAACGAVYTLWQVGTIRVSKALRCKMYLTHERTYHLWREYLSFDDDTPPVLPEPDIDATAAG